MFFVGERFLQVYEQSDGNRATQPVIFSIDNPRSTQTGRSTALNLNIIDHSAC